MGYTKLKKKHCLETFFYTVRQDDLDPELKILSYLFETMDLSCYQDVQNTKSINVCPFLVR
jgi:hypothetical protein